MKLLLKTFFITFTLIQAVQAGRYYNTENGRFISRDPLGYVDGMSLYNAYFAEQLTLDPMGTKAHDTQPKDGYEYFKVPKDIIAKIKAVECVKLNMIWLDGIIKINIPGAEPIQSDLEDFFQNAPNDECNINMNMMHGLKWDKETKKYVEDNNTYPKESKNKCRTAKYGYYTCYNEEHNKLIPENNRIPDLPKDPDEIRTNQINDILKKNLPALIKQLQEMCKCCDTVNVNIFLGRFYKKDKMEEDTKDIDINVPEPLNPPR